MAIRKSKEESYLVDGTRSEWMSKCENALINGGFSSVTVNALLYQLKANYKKLTTWGDITITLTEENSKVKIHASSSANVDNVYALVNSPNQTIFNQFKQNLGNASNASINSTSNNINQNTNNTQKKQCQNCKSNCSLGDSFCMKCGFNFAEYEKQKQDRLKENEKECPECKLVMDKSISSCTNCGFPFTANTTTFSTQNETNNFKKDTAIVSKIEQNKTNISQHQNISNRETPPKPAQSSQQHVTTEKKGGKNKALYIILGSILVLAIIVSVWVYKNYFSPEKQAMDFVELMKENAKIDTYTETSSSDNLSDENNGGIVNSESNLAPNTNEISTKIYKYYEDIQLGSMDATNYFASNVSQYITKKNLTPEDINKSISKGQQEFSRPEFVLNIDNIVNNKVENEVWYYSFPIHFKCFSTSKKKIQECDIDIEIGVNQAGEFVSIKETKIENLRFYEEEIYIPSESENSNEPNNEVFSAVEQMPEFSGGMGDLMKYLQNNINYPQVEKEAGIQGKVFTRFVVNSDGSISNVEVLKGVAGGDGLSKEAIRVVKSMPKWLPGKQNGRTVPVYFNLPINFRLN